MTENEIREMVQSLRNRLETFIKSGWAIDGLINDYTKSADTIEKLFEEIQQYRAIGTVEGYKRAIDVSLENYNLYKQYKEKVQAFEAIGTIEEFKALKEKNVGKMMDGYYCPICRHYFEDTDAYNYCPVCGQKMKSILE